MTATANVQKIQAKLNELIRFVELHRHVLSEHIVNIFTEDLWRKNIPLNVQKELDDVSSLEEFATLYPQTMNNDRPELFDKYPNTYNFFKSHLKMSIKNDSSFITSVKALQEYFSSKGCDTKTKISLKGFATVKKIHEVEMAGQMVSLLTNFTRSSHVLDIGGGKGYLSSLLALHYDYKVLGVDCSEITTKGAIKRSQKLVKHWKSVTVPNSYDENDNLEKKIVNEEYLNRQYKQTVAFVTADMNLSDLIKKNFDDHCTGLTLSGLHTCGDLGPTSLKMFVNDKLAKAVINIGCCYHLMKEQFYTHPFWNGVELPVDNDEFGFPMSKFLKDQEFYLGENLKKVAMYSLERLGDFYYDEAGFRSTFYRSVLETVIDDDKRKHSRSGKIKNLVKMTTNFHEYMHKALKKLDMKDMTDEEITKLYNNFKDKEKMVTIYHYFRMSVSGVVESIFILDRLLYILESGIENAHIVHLFDPKISPIGFAIVAWKNNEDEKT